MVKSNNSIPWINHKVKRSLKRKHRLYRQAKKTNNWSNYKYDQKECRQNIRRAEYQYINKNIMEGLQNNNSKPFWKYIKSKKQDSIGVAPLKDHGKLFNDAKDKADFLVK
jgi:hypothetical protein